MEISTPILLNVEFLGVLIVIIGSEELFKITLDRTGLGETGEIYLVNKDYYMISPSRFSENVILKQKIDSVNARNCFDHRFKEYMPMSKMTSVFKDYRGTNVLGTHEYIPEMKWALLAEIDLKEGLAPLKKISRLIVILLVFIPIVTWLIGVFFAKTISRPIDKLRKGTKIISEGNIDYKVGTDSKDEVGQLSRAFDKMTKNLKKTTTSIDILQKEILERQRAEEALRESERRCRTVLEANPDPVVVYDVDGKVIYFNPAFVHVFGWSLEDCIGKKMDVFVPEKSWPETKMMIEKLLSEENFSGIESQRYTKEGNIVPVSISGSIYRNKEGIPVGSVVNLRNISEQKKIEVQFAQTQKLESIGQLAAGIAHEINTPTQYIGDNTQFLQDAFHDLGKVLKRYGQLLEAVKEEVPIPIDDLVQDVESIIEEVDLNYLDKEIPAAIQQTLDGINHVTKIVRSMKDFSHPGLEEKNCC